MRFCASQNRSSHPQICQTIAYPEEGVCPDRKQPQIGKVRYLADPVLCARTVGWTRARGRGRGRYEVDDEITRKNTLDFLLGLIVIHFRTPLHVAARRKPNDHDIHKRVVRTTLVLTVALSRRRIATQRRSRRSSFSPIRMCGFDTSAQQLQVCVAHPSERVRSRGHDGRETKSDVSGVRTKSVGKRGERTLSTQRKKYVQKILL